MSELGNRLRTAREAQGKSVADVAHVLLVRKTIIEALEENRFGDLPEATLTRGYIKRYAQALGLDPEPLLAHYPKAVVADSPASRNLAAASKKTTVELPPKSARTGFPWLVVLPVLILAGGALAWYVSTNRERLFPAQNPPTQNQAVEPSPPVASVPTTPEPAAPVEPKKVRLSLSTNPASARIYLDGYQLKNPVNDMFEAGERELRVEASGYQTYSETLRLVDDYNKVISLQVAAEAITPPTLNPSQVPGQAQPTQPAPGQPIQPGQAQPTQPAPGQPTQPGQAQPIQPAPGQPTQPGQALPNQPGQAQNGLVVKLEGSSWIQIVSRGQVVYTGIPKPGSQLSYPLPASVRSGNAGVVRVVVNGKDQGPMGRVGQVITRRYTAPVQPTPPAP